MSVRDDCPEHGRKCEHWLLVKTLADERNALRAEVAALREERDAPCPACKKLLEVEHKLAEARKLLARWERHGNTEGKAFADDVRAFLRRDEARWEPSDNVFTHDETKDAPQLCMLCGTPMADHATDSERTAAWCPMPVRDEAPGGD